jgi:uncharacterized RDD family membrane protein YckC
MTSPNSQAAESDLGVYFFAEDYANLPRRMAILAIDFCILLVIFVFLVMFSVLANAFAEESGIRLSGWPFVIMFVATCWSYLAVLEGTSVGTLGFLVTGVKIVDLHGRRPSVLRMTFRLLLWALGPFNFVYDLVWLAGDAHKQSLRDKIAGTFVVRYEAIPAGQAPIKLARLMFMGWTFTFYEVKKPVSAIERKLARS